MLIKQNLEYISFYLFLIIVSSLILWIFWNLRKDKLFWLNNLGFIILIPTLFFITPIGCKKDNIFVQGTLGLQDITKEKMIFKYVLSNQDKKDNCKTIRTDFDQIYLSANKEQKAFLVSCITFDLLEEIRLIYLLDAQYNLIFGPILSGSFSSVDMRNLDEDADFEIIEEYNIWKYDIDSKRFLKNTKLSDRKHKAYKYASGGNFEFFFLVLTINLISFIFITNSSIKNRSQSIVIGSIYIIILLSLLIPISFVAGELFGFLYFTFFPFFYKYINKLSLLIMRHLKIGFLERFSTLYRNNGV
jgi:hypothetical protein